MHKFEFLRQPLMGELAMSRKKKEREREREKNAIYSGHLCLCQQPRAAHALRSDQHFLFHFSLKFFMMVGHVDHFSNDHILVLGDDREHGPHHHQAADQE